MTAHDPAVIRETVIALKTTAENINALAATMTKMLAIGAKLIERLEELTRA